MAPNEDLYFKLFACCIPVKGAKQSTICDLQRDQYVIIPNILFYILTRFNNKKVGEIKAYFDHKNNREIDEYFDVLIKKELGFFTEGSKNFPPLNFNETYNYNIISNAIIDFDSASKHDLNNILDQLSKLYCEAVEIRFFCKIELGFFSQLLSYVKDSTLRSIEITIPYSKDFDKSRMLDLQQLNPRIKRMIIYGAPHNEVIEGEDVIIYYTADNISSESCCGLVSPWHFISKTELFAESKKFNNCLNKKIGIDTRGEIKNCPSMAESYGNVNSTDLNSVIHNSRFTEVWKVTKDQIEVCKDCEFRYICQDCRAYVQNPENKLSKPLKCTYDPYEAKWN